MRTADATRQRPAAGVRSSYPRNLLLQTVYVLVLIEIGSPRVHCAGCSVHPDNAQVARHARQVRRPMPCANGCRAVSGSAVRNPLLTRDGPIDNPAGLSP